MLTMYKQKSPLFLNRSPVWNCSFRTLSYTHFTSINDSVNRSPTAYPIHRVGKAKIRWEEMDISNIIAVKETWNGWKPELSWRELQRRKWGERFIGNIHRRRLAKRPGEGCTLGWNDIDALILKTKTSSPWAPGWVSERANEWAPELSKQCGLRSKGMS